MGNENLSILIVDDNPKNLQVLGTILQQTGYSVEFAVDGKNAIDWIEDRDFDLILLDIMMPEMDGYKACSKIKAIHGKGHIPIIFLTAKTDMDSLVKGFELGAVDYITKPFNKNELLARVNNHLQLKLVTDKLKISIEKEQELSKLKSRFVSIASHEFRTPLTSILSTSEIIKKYHNKMTEGELDERLKRIQEEVHYMTAILEDILIIGKSDYGKNDFNPAKIDMIKYAKELINEFCMTYNDNRNISFDYNIDKLVVSLDMKWIKHIFNNLLTNAVKYSDQNSQVKVLLTNKPDTIAFQFIDQGIGIPKEDQELLFTSFHRARNVGNIQGTGLGLSIVKKAVDIHGGTINVSSVLNKGTTFTIEIPKNQEIEK